MQMATSAHELTPAVQDYVKAIYGLESAGRKATTSSLAERMGVSAPSVVAMTKRLAQLGLLERPPYAPRSGDGRARDRRASPGRRPGSTAVPREARARPRQRGGAHVHRPVRR